MVSWHLGLEMAVTEPRRFPLLVLVVALMVPDPLWLVGVAK